MASLLAMASLSTVLAWFAVLLFGGALLVSIRKAWFGLLLMVPWSLAWPDSEGAGMPLVGLVVEVPIEPAMALLCFALVVRRSTRQRLIQLLQEATAPTGARWFRWFNPLSLIVGLIAVHLAWMVVSSLVSADPSSGIKELVVRVLVLTSFFLAPLALFRSLKTSDDELPRNTGDSITEGMPRWQQLVDRSPWVLGAGLVPMIVWSAVNQLSVGPYLASHPWYRGHIEYGQSLAVASLLLLPVAIGQAHRTQVQVWLARLLVSTFWTGILIGRSRSAVLLLLVALPVFILVRRAVRARPLVAAVSASFLLGCLVFVSVLQVRSHRLVVPPDERLTMPFAPIVESLLSERLFADESMTERYNRWDAAVAMARERPLFGFGPGSFESNYGGFQQAALKTRFSTDSGDLGDVHSHYLEFLVEQGLVGLLISLLLFVGPIYCSMLNAEASASGRCVAHQAGVAAALSGLMVSSVFSTFLTLQEMAPLYFLLLVFAVGPRAPKRAWLSSWAKS